MITQKTNRAKGRGNITINKVKNRKISDAPANCIR